MLDDVHLDHLFIAIPELRFNLRLMEKLLELGAIDSSQYDRYVTGRKTASRADKVLAAAMKGDTLIARILGVIPELMTTEIVDILSGVGLVSKTQGHAMRIAIRTLNTASRGGLPTDKGQIATRAMRVLGAQLSNERIDLWRSMGLITAGEAERYRGYLRAGKGVGESLAKARRAKSLLDALVVLGEISISKQVVDGMVQAGLITPRLGRVYNSLIVVGQKQWKVFKGSGRADGFRARALLVLTGSFNRELLDYLVVSKIITRQQWKNLQIAELIARNVNDRLLDDLTKRRYRVAPGVPPIRTFAAASRANDGQILRLLAQAARESAKEASQIAGAAGIGGKIRASQYRLVAAGLHEAMRDMWDGVGYLTIWGEREVSEAAVESLDMLDRRVLKHMPPGTRASLLWQAKSGVDSYISREENTLELSRRVYSNIAFFEGRVDQRIKINLLRGRSAVEVAKDIEKFISPHTPGGVSYAAMRLARTEINNAFHFSQIRYSREQPWVRGYEWKLSGSHPKPDICNTYAEGDHDNLGPGVFKKANVPGKPHPHCFCYIVTVVMDENDFISAFRAGRFSSYMAQIDKGNAYPDDNSSQNLSQYLQTGAGNVFSGISL